MYHRNILRNLLSHSVYGNIIRCSNGYQDEFPSDFLDIQKHINYNKDHNEFITSYNGENYPGVYTYSDAVIYYVNYKYQILKEAIMDNCINMSLNQEIIDMKLFEESLYECIKNNDYELCSIRGVTTKFLKVLNDDYYDLTKLFVKYDCETIKEL